MVLSAVLVLCCITMVDSTCDISKEKSMISSMLQSIEKKMKASGECTSPENCPVGWKEYKTHCYFFSPDTKTWRNAEKQCKNMGGYLVQITDSAENSWVLDMLMKSCKHHHGSWIGASDLKKEGDWRWVNDSSKVRYSQWHRGNPNNYGNNEDCAHFASGSYQYHWNDAPCNIDGMMGYICECSHESNCRPFNG
ncbi:perlucin-like protein [Mytilus galloprovincialis]|uniref:perlucin-like protein n=1 Tax=Mytilus galloprovincialis TaxID=29158 RepID=UPI003F7B6F1D